MADSDDELRARADARVGTVLRGKYTVERVIGIGGMASVYAALHRNGRRVALKLLHPELSIRADLRKRFLREAQAANAVNTLVWSPSSTTTWRRTVPRSL